jgi:transposase
VRARAVKLVFDHQDEYPSQWRCIESVATKLGVNREALRQWVRRAEVDAGQRAGVTTDERARIAQLERENRELRRANEILKAASAFFGAELDRQSQI